MVKKLMKLPGVGMNGSPVVPLGTSSVLAIVAGVAAVVGMSTLHKHRAAQSGSSGSNTGNTATQVAVGLLSVHVPQNFRYRSPAYSCGCKLLRASAKVYAWSRG